MTVPPGISLALDDEPTTADPTWTRLDDPAAARWALSWEITGPNRSSETDRPGTGSATITLRDLDGTWDLTNPYSTLAAKLRPGIQGAICVADSAGAWHWRFRGIVDEITVELDQTGQYATVTVELIDAFAYLSQIRMRPGVFGDTVPAGSEGDIWFDATTGADEASARMDQVLDTIGWPAGLRRLFTGNVQLQGSVYSRDEEALAVILDAADAEFPGVGVVFTSKEGIITFHGRHARFDPESYQSTDDLSRSGGNSICFWQAISANMLGSLPDGVLCTQVGYRLSRKDVINDAVALPAGVDDTDPAVWTTNHVQDALSQAAYGVFSWSADNLRTLSGAGGTTPLEETALFASYYVANYSEPRVRVNSISFVSRQPGMVGADALADFLAGFDLSDVLTITTSHFTDDQAGWGGSFGFDEDYYIDGFTISGTTDTADGSVRIAATIDVSPRAFFTTDPWAS